MKQFVAVAEYQFHGPAPHVHDQDLPIVKGHALPDPEINQSGFLQACDDADTDARLLLDGLDECSAVGRLANRTCRNRFNSRKSAIAGEGSEATDRLHALRNGLRREHPGFKCLIAEPRHILMAGDDFVRKVRLDFRQHHVDRVAADVQEREFEHLPAERMADDFPFDHVNDQFRDVCRVVGDALEIFGNEGDPDGPRDRLRVLQHERQQLPEQLVGQIIHEIVVCAHASCQVRVSADKSVQRLFYHL